MPSELIESRTAATLPPGQGHDSGGNLLRALLRLRLFYKLIIANVAILLVAVLAAASVAHSLNRANPSAGIAGAVWLVALLAVGVSAVANILLVRLALTPFDKLQEAARRVQQGDAQARAELSPLADPDFEQLTIAFNAMLDRLAQHRVRMRELTVHALEAGEAERKRLAAELHDGIAQSMTALLMQLRVVRNTQDEVRRSELLAATSEQLSALIEELRAIASGLRPPALDMLGLMAALKAHARMLSEASNIRIDIVGEDLDRLLSPRTELALYRLLQEALANVTRHSQARAATLEIQPRAGSIVARIRDDGRGFRVEEELARHNGFGLFSMHERAAHVGGRVTVASTPGRGTEVTIEFPQDGAKANNG